MIPPKQFIHDPNIKGGTSNTTIRKRLQEKEFPIPNEWYDNKYKQKHDYQPQYLNDALNSIITERPDNINAEQQHEYGYTVAMIYASQGIIPPKQWEHRSELQDSKGHTVAMLLAENKICDIPQQWYHKSDLQDKYWYDRYTVAMIYAQNKIIPPKEWEHDSNLQDNYGDTVAMYLAQNSIIPPQQWHHNPYIADEDEKTVQDYLIENNINIPEQWKYEDKQIDITETIQQQLDEYCEENEIQNQQVIINYPQYQKCDWYNTFAVYLELKGIITPKEFQHDPEYILKHERTTAMKIAKYGKIPSKCWEHDPLLKDGNNNTVAILLTKNGIVPPKQWIHDVDINNNQNQSIRSNLLRYDYYYINNEFIKLTEDTIKQCIQTEILDDVCQICLEEQEQIFIKTNCNHKICLQCFKEIFKANTYKNCPICRQNQWFKLIDQTQ